MENKARILRRRKKFSPFAGKKLDKLKRDMLHSASSVQGTALAIRYPITTGRINASEDIHGRMAEWLIVPPWKGGIRKFRIEGSNPSPSARIAYLDELVSSRRAKRASYNGHYLSFPS